MKRVETIKWQAGWYGLDQSIVVGDVDVFNLFKEKPYFYNELLKENCYEKVKAEVISISHPDLGSVKGIINGGLDYSIYLDDGSEIVVNAEESPGDIWTGEIWSSEHAVKEWEFEVQLIIIKKIAPTSNKNLELLSVNEGQANWQEYVKRYKKLLNITESTIGNWDR